MAGEVPDARPYIARMDVLVNASEREPFGIVLLEGMAAGAADRRRGLRRPRGDRRGRSHRHARALRVPRGSR